MENKIVMFTDGGSRGNPGPSAVGVYFESLNKQHSEYIGIRTNNEAEFKAVISGLKKLKQILGNTKCKESKIYCFSDSELMVNQLNHKYKLLEERIQELFIEIWNLMLDFKDVGFYKIPREENEIADRLVNEELNRVEREQKLTWKNYD